MDEATPGDRCGFVPEPVDADSDEDRRSWWASEGMASCWRPAWRDSDDGRCVWHADVEDKPVEALVADHTDTDEFLDSAVLRGVEAGDELSLAGVTLREADFLNADFSGADLTGASLQEADLANANFSGATLADATLNDADLSHASLDGADLTDANLWRATMAGVDLSNAEAPNTSLIDADMAHANFERADLSGSNLHAATLERANFQSADLTEATLQEADLTDALLPVATLSGAALVGADLTEATLVGADLDDALLSGTTLVDASLPGSNLVDADLAGANLANADFREATLTGATLEGARLDGTSLEETDLRGATLIDAELDGVSLREADLTDATLRGTTLNRVKLENTVFDGIDLDARTEFGQVSGWERDADETATAALDRVERLPGPLRSLGRPYTDDDPLERAEIQYRTIQRLYREQDLREEIGLAVQEQHARRKRALADRRLFDWLKLAVYRWALGYGLKPWNVLATSLLVIATAAGLFPVWGLAVTKDSAAIDQVSYLQAPTAPLAEIGTSLYFSIVTFTTLGYGDVQPMGFGEMIAVSEALLGALLTAFLVYVLGRRASW
jgi:uncharacterized protein YjbI with pentapeptide repeats